MAVILMAQRSQRQLRSGDLDHQAKQQPGLMKRLRHQTAPFGQFQDMARCEQYMRQVLDNIQEVFGSAEALVDTYQQYDKGPQVLEGQPGPVDMGQFSELSDELQRTLEASYRAWGPSSVVGIGAEVDERTKRRGFSVLYCSKLVHTRETDNVFCSMLSEIDPDVASDMVLCALTYMVYDEAVIDGSRSWGELVDAVRANLDYLVDHDDKLGVFHEPYHPYFINYLSFGSNGSTHAYGDFLSEDESQVLWALVSRVHPGYLPNGRRRILAAHPGGSGSGSQTPRRRRRDEDSQTPPRRIKSRWPSAAAEAVTTRSRAAASDEARLKPTPEL